MANSRLTLRPNAGLGQMKSCRLPRSPHLGSDGVRLRPPQLGSGQITEYPTVALFEKHTHFERPDYSRVKLLASITSKPPASGFFEHNIEPGLASKPQSLDV